MVVVFIRLSIYQNDYFIKNNLEIDFHLLLTFIVLREIVLQFGSNSGLANKNFILQTTFSFSYFFLILRVDINCRQLSY